MILLMDSDQSKGGNSMAKKKVTKKVVKPVKADKQVKKKKVKVPPVAGFDRGPRDFFRGSTGFFNKDLKIQNKGFIGMRRGSR